MKQYKQIRYTYALPDSIKNILQDAVNVRSHTLYGTMPPESMTLMLGTTGIFMLHHREVREAPCPQVRVLKLPDSITDSEAFDYALTHSDEFTEWQYSVYEGKSEGYY